MTDVIREEQPEDAGPPEGFVVESPTEPDPADLEGLFDDDETPSMNGNEPAAPALTPTADETPCFVSLREFVKITFPPAEALIGAPRKGTNLAPRFGWVMDWGPEGSGKTSIALDLMFHAAAGQAWLDYPALRPVRFVCVVNEGVPGGFQDKLVEKLETWNGDKDLVLDGLAVYRSPWGAFTLQDQRMREHLRDFARDFNADYISLDPLHTVGTVGAGSPQDTEQFKNLLRELGLWESVGVITTHHANKAGMVSGDWGRHPDTLIRLEKDGDRPATKYILQKARPADPNELHVVQILEWETDTLGYRRVQRDAKSPQAVGAGNRDKVLQAAREGQTTLDAIAACTGLSDRTVASHLKKLEEADHLTLLRGAKGKLIVASVGDESEAGDE